MPNLAAPPPRDQLTAPDGDRFECCLRSGEDQQSGIKILRQVSASSALPPPPRPVKIYFVKTGDTLSAIAKQMKTTLTQLLASNPAHKNKDLIGVGQRIRIPS